MLAKESIFTSALRGFFKSFSIILGTCVAIVVICVGLMFLSGPGVTPNHSDLTIAPDAQGNRELLPATAPVILKLNIHGIIGQGDITAENIMNCLLDSREGMLHGDRVKGILLHMNTPGGTVTDSDAIYRLLLDYKKKYHVPVYAYIDGLCASGGMYIACSADKIYASPPSVIGSVGVVLGPTFNFSKLMDTYGVQSLTFTAGKDKDMLNPFRPWVPGEDECLRTMITSLYDRFITIVTAARPTLNKTALIEQYGAQIFLAKQAADLGYIDMPDTEWYTALSELAKASHIEEGISYQVFEIEPPHAFLSDLANSHLSLLQGKITHEVKLHPTLNPELYGQFLYLYTP